MKLIDWVLWTVIVLNAATTLIAAVLWFHRYKDLLASSKHKPRRIRTPRRIRW